MKNVQKYMQGYEVTEEFISDMNEIELKNFLIRNTLKQLAETNLEDSPIEVFEDYMFDFEAPIEHKRFKARIILISGSYLNHLLRQEQKLLELEENTK